MKYKLWFTPNDDDCLAEEIAELHVVSCDNDATYTATDNETGEETPLCAEHKDDAKAAGIAL